MVCDTKNDNNLTENPNSICSEDDSKPQKAAPIIAIAIAVMSIIFTVFIGCIEHLYIYSTHNSLTLIDYLGPIYSKIPNFIKIALALSSSKRTYLLSTSYYLEAIIITIICYATLITVTTLAIITIVRASRAIAGKPGKKIGLMPLATFAAFVVGAICCRVMFFSYHKSIFDATIYNSTRYNIPTIIGFIVGDTLAIAYFIVNAKTLLSKPYIVHNSLVLASILVLIILLITVSFPALSYSFYSILKFYPPALIRDAGYTLENTMTSAIAIFILSVMATVFLCYMIICSIWMIIAQMRKFLVPNSPDHSLALSIQIVIASTFSLIFSIAALLLYISTFITRHISEAKISCIPLIIIIVLSLILLGIQIAQKTISKKKSLTT